VHRFTRRVDSEHEQVLIRFVVGLLLVGYFWSPYMADLVALPLNLLIMKIGIGVFLHPLSGHRRGGGAVRLCHRRPVQ